MAATWDEVSLVILVIETAIRIMLTTTLRLELARSAASARHVVVCVKGGFVCEVRGRLSPSRKSVFVWRVVGVIVL